MEDLHKYFYSVFAACLIALGSCLIISIQYLQSVENEAKKISYKVEENAHIKFDKAIDCVALKADVANCKYAIHLFTTNEGYFDLLRKSANILMTIITISGLIGIALHYRLIITSKSNKKTV